MASCNAVFLEEVERFLQETNLSTNEFQDQEIGLPIEDLPTIPNSPTLFLGATTTLPLGPSAAALRSDESTSSEDEPINMNAESLWSSSCERSKRKAEAVAPGPLNESKRRRFYRQRAQKERADLKKEVTQLSNQLAELTQALKEQNDDGYEVVNSISMWQTIAKCHREERHQAEKEQEGLIAAVANQRSFIEEVIAFVSKQHSILPVAQLSLRRGSCIMEMRKDALLYREQLARLNTNYARIGDVFTKNGFDSIEEGVLKTIVTNPDGTPKYSQYRNRTEYQIEFGRVCASMWELTHLYGQLLGREEYNGVTNPENTYAVKFRREGSIQTGGQASIKLRLAIRRFVSERSMILVWRTFVEGEGAFCGMHSTESGWCRVRPSKAGALMEMYLTQMPMCFTSAVPCEPVRDHFCELVFDFARERGASVLDGMEMLSLHNH